MTAGHPARDPETLARELEELRDLRAIEALKHAYTGALDSGYDPEEIGALFTEDARWVAEGFGDYRGREEICSFFERLSRSIVQVRHYATSPRVRIDPGGETARSEWNLLCLCLRRHRDKPDAEVPIVEIGGYRDVLRKVDGEWLFAELAVDVTVSRQVADLVI